MIVFLYINNYIVFYYFLDGIEESEVIPILSLNLSWIVIKLPNIMFLLLINRDIILNVYMIPDSCEIWILEF